MTEYPADLDEQLQQAQDRTVEAANQVRSHLRMLAQLCDHLDHSLQTMPVPDQGPWWEFSTQLQGLKAAQERHRTAYAEVHRLGALRNQRDRTV